MQATTSYTDQQKLEIIKRNLPPEKLSMSVLSQKTGVPTTTLYGWKKKFKASFEIPKQTLSKGSWSTQDKFHMVVETYALNEAELAQYCRRTGLYVDQIKTWRNKCTLATDSNAPDPAVLVDKLKEQTIKAKQLESNNNEPNSKGLLALCGIIITATRHVVVKTINKYSETTICCGF